MIENDSLRLLHDAAANFALPEMIRRVYNGMPDEWVRVNHREFFDRGGYTKFQLAAYLAYKQADAMIAERNKERG